MVDSARKLTEGAVRANARARMFSILRKAWKKRSAEGMTAKDLAARLGRDKAQVSRVLNGSVPTITMETLALFLDGLDHQLMIDCRAAEDAPLSNSAAAIREPDADSIARLETPPPQHARVASKSAPASLSTANARKRARAG